MTRKTPARKSSKARQKKKLSLKNLVILALLAVVLIAIGQTGSTLADDSAQQPSPSPSGSAGSGSALPSTTPSTDETSSPSGPDTPSESGSSHPIATPGASNTPSGPFEPYTEAELAVIALEASTAELSLKAEGQSTTYEQAKAKLTKLPVKGRAPKTGYSRDQFGQAWADADWNDCDTRNDILRRDLIEPRTDTQSAGCKVLYGTLKDRFTGSTIDFVRGEHTSPLVQIDHIVALSDAWQKGAQGLTPRARLNFANDPLNLVAVDGPSNNAKSDKDAASWLPKNRDYRCDFAATQVDVKTKYALWVTQAERDALAKVLDACSGNVTPIKPVPHTRDSVRATSAGYREALAEASNSGTSSSGAGNPSTASPSAGPSSRPTSSATADGPHESGDSSKSDPGVSPISTAQCPADAPIKGNQGNSGWKYHVPGGRWYDNTNPEQCFRTAKGAAAAGYEYAQNQ